jgi:hypothetical protein
MVGLVYDLTDFHRVMVYRFDETAAGIYFFSLVEQQTVMLLHMSHSKLRFRQLRSSSTVSLILIIYFLRLGGELVCRYSHIDRHLQRPSLSSVRYSKASTRAIRYQHDSNSLWPRARKSSTHGPHLWRYQSTPKPQTFLSSSNESDPSSISRQRGCGSKHVDLYICQSEALGLVKDFDGSSI